MIGYSTWFTFNPSTGLTNTDVYAGLSQDGYEVVEGAYESKTWRVEAGEDNIQGVFVIVSLNTAAVREMLLHKKPVSTGNLDSVLPTLGVQAA